MTTIKLLSTGLIAIAMLATSAVARERRVYVGNSTTAGRSYKLPVEPDGHWIIWGGIPIWFGPSVRGWPGHICDWGDNARICGGSETAASRFMPFLDPELRGRTLC